MLNPLWKMLDSPDHPITTINNDDSLMSRLGLKTVLIFCSSRAWRGPRSRSLLQVTAFLFTILLLFRLLPERLASSEFATGYKHMLPWGASKTPESGDDLRIVVFGSPDLVGSAGDVANRRTTWTEQLCQELNCSSHLSFVPSIESGHGLTSNSIYEKELRALQNITASTNITESPASNFVFIKEQYPVPAGVPDLAAQVKEFLAMPPPKVPPRETLWIFTFGTWEVWNLAAMPSASGNAVVDASVAHIFEQIELLYAEALEPTSIAFSDFWSNATESEVDTLTVPESREKVDERKLESFRVLIPYLFDISLTPGWQSRPLPSAPNSMAEQMRKAAGLTVKWNSGIRSQMDGWKRKGSTKPELIKEQPEHLVEVSESNTLLKYMPSSVPPSAHPEHDKESDPVIYAPYPHRNAWHTNPAIRILDAMTEEEMQRGGVQDSKGRGTLSVNDTMRFLDVWTPCYKSVKDKPLADGEEEKEECEAPNNHLFLDPFSVGQRAIEGLAKSAAADVMQHLFKKEEKKPSWLSRRGSEKSFIRKVRS